MIKTTFLVLNLILLIGLFFEGNTVGLYLCTFAPFLYLVARNKGKLQVNIAIVIVIIFIANIIIQIFFGYPPDVKLVLNFVGNLVMVYAIISLLDSKNKLGDYLESLFKLQIILGMFFVMLSILIFGKSFFITSLNEVYVTLDELLPFISIQKQLLAPFLFFSSLMSFYLIKPGYFFRNSLVFLFIICAMYMSLGSRSVILGTIIMGLIFIFRKNFSNIVFSVFSVSSVVIFVLLANIFLESYIDIIRLIDIRGVVYSEVIDEITYNPIGIGYGNTVPFLVQNNSALFSDSIFYLEDLKNSNDSFSQFEFESFPVNVESSFLITALEQGIIITIILYSFFLTKIARMYRISNKLYLLYMIGFTVIFFTSLTEDSFLTIPFIFYTAIFLRLDTNRRIIGM